MENMARHRTPSYELIPDPERNSILYRQHGFPHPLVQWHYHKEYELHLITHSSGKVFIGDYIGNFRPNNLILTGPNLPHNWITQTEDNEVFPERDRVVVFTDDWIKSARDFIPEMTLLDELLDRSRFGIEFLNPATIKMVKEIMFEIANEQDALKRLSCFLKAMGILANTTDYQILSSENYLTLNSENYQYRINKAIKYIIENYQLEIKLEEVSEHLQMEPTYFSRFFKRATGRRFVEFVNSLRVARACDLLAHGNMPITDICFDVGFMNISNFNRHFQALKEITPSEYRKLSSVACSKTC
jgi:AraC-like DNA-binding protein